MISYPLTLPCPRVSGHKVNTANTIESSKFDYGIEQQYSSKDTNKFNFSIACNYEQLNEFKDFFSSLYDGVSPFTADWLILGDTSLKNIRFTSQYTLTSLGHDKYEIKANCEVL